MTRAVAPSDPYSHPGFAPVATELRGARLAIEGDLPAGLDGVFLRNGTNARFPPRRRHMFDGEAMVHMIELRGGEARYSNTHVRTPRTAYVERTGRNPFLGIGDLTSGGKRALVSLMVERVKTRLGVLPRLPTIEAGSNSTALLHHDNRLYALQETALPFRLQIARDPNGWLALSGRGEYADFGGTLAVPFSAHPKADASSGSVYSIGQDFLGGITYLTVLERGGVSRTLPLGQGKPPAFFVHDTVLTERHIVFPDTSLRFDPGGLAKPQASVAGFDPAHRLRFGVISRDHGENDPVQWFETQAPGHIWHIANGWEEDGVIHVYAPVFREYPSTLPIHTPAEPHASFVHWQLDLATGAVRERMLLDHHYERPSVDPRRHGRASRYVYLLDQGGGVMGQGVLKYDLLEERAAGYLDYGDLLGGEAVFVPRRMGGNERDDEGWLIDLLADGQQAALIVADAASMNEVCRIALPLPVPFGVHALWLGEAEADALIAD